MYEAVSKLISDQINDQKVNISIEDISSVYADTLSSIVVTMTKDLLRATLFNSYTTRETGLNRPNPILRSSITN